MQVTTQIGTDRDFRLKQAVLIYEDAITKRGSFVTVHPVHVPEDGQPASLGPGRLLTTKFLESLDHCLQRAPRPQFLPENILASTSDLLVWWTPPRLRPVYFSDGAEDRASINGRVCPHPSLLWKVHRGRLSLVQCERPKPDTPLMVAPYWNTNSADGNVCEGSMARPKETDISNKAEWEEGFFNSEFTHPNGVGKLTSHPGGFMGLWADLAGKDVFPGRYLLPCRETLIQFVEKR